MRIRLCLVAAAAFVSSVSVGSAHAADVLAPAVGGSGGEPFAKRCPEGQMLVGIEGRAGDKFDQAAPVCGAATTPTKTDLTKASIGSAAGGAGGKPLSLRCPAGAPFVVGAYISAEGLGDIYVDGISLYCGEAAVGQSMPQRPSAQHVTQPQPCTDEFLAVGKCSERDYAMSSCAPDSVAVGIHGRAGALLDSIGLICGDPVVTSPPSPNVAGALRSKDGAVSGARVSSAALKGAVAAAPASASQSVSSAAINTAPRRLGKSTPPQTGAYPDLPEPGPSRAQLQTDDSAVFAYPHVKGPLNIHYPLDWCRLWASECGKPAADAYCRMTDPRRPFAVAFEKAPDIGALRHTLVLGTGQTCTNASCDGFKSVTCSAEAHQRAPEPEPQPMPAPEPAPEEPQAEAQPEQ